MIEFSAVAWHCVIKAKQRSLSIHHVGNDKGWGVRFSQYGISPSHPYHIGNNYIADASSTTPRVPYARLQTAQMTSHHFDAPTTVPEDLHLSIRSIIWPRNKIRAIRRRHNKVQEEGTDQRVHWRKVEWQGLYINCNILVEVDIEGCTTNKSGTKSRVWLTTKGADKNEVKINPKYDHIPKQDANR